MFQTRRFIVQLFCFFPQLLSFYDFSDWSHKKKLIKLIEFNLQQISLSIFEELIFPFNLV